MNKTYEYIVRALTVDEALEIVQKIKNAHSEDEVVRIKVNIKQSIFQ